jgi:hypothetical protein
MRSRIGFWTLPGIIKKSVSGYPAYGTNDKRLKSQSCPAIPLESGTME